MNEQMIDEFIEKATAEVPAERRDDVKRDMKFRIMKKAMDQASREGRPVDDEIIGGVLKTWPPYMPLKAIAVQAPPTVAPPDGRGKVLLSVAGLLASLVILDILFVEVVPDASGTSSATASSIAAAVALAIVASAVAVCVILVVMRFYDRRIRKTKEDRIRHVERVQKGIASPVRAGVLAVAMAIWMIVLCLLWKDVTVPSFNTSGTVIHVFSDGFSSFVPLILALGVAVIIVNALFLALPQKWIVSLADTVVNAGVMLMFLVMIQAFPFSADFSPVARDGIYLVLALVFLVLAVGVAKNLLQTLNFIDYDRYKADLSNLGQL